MTECWLIRHGNSASDLEMLSRAVYRHRMLRILTLAIALLVIPAVSASGQDFQKGVAAYRSGDYATALREWTPLAEQGHASAQGNLGVMYENGQGAPQDYKAAVRWYRLAAEQGQASAQYNLGVMYRKGQGVPQDDKAAVNWYRLAAEQGHAAAQNNLGGMYAQGQGVTQDNVYAHMWWNIAASSGLKDAVENRDIVAGKMTPAQIEKAQDLARECVAKNYKGC